ncbi:MAG TPA: 2-oxoglutarate dehydrogenase E1 component, partial [Gemmataceae bacterium]|nr:2-oxoglutarate dehydrogenase E1 component [Gemmataceae bacterium]
FLQLCADDNMQVVMASTPAQHFHMLRRQMVRNFRKPLIVMTPKSMLRVKISQISDLVDGRFYEVIDDATATPERIRRVLLCSGKVFHELAKLRTKTETDDVAIVRVEQFYPFPEGQLHQALDRYRNAEEHVWVQEESQNMGGWWFMEPRLRAMGFPAEYVGRDASASPATGSHEVHKREQEELVEAAIRGAAPHLVRAAGPSWTRVAEPASANGPRREEHAVSK